MKDAKLNTFFDYVTGLLDLACILGWLTYSCWLSCMIFYYITTINIFFVINIKILEKHSLYLGWILLWLELQNYFNSILNIFYIYIYVWILINYFISFNFLYLIRYIYLLRELGSIIFSC